MGTMGRESPPSIAEITTLSARRSRQPQQERNNMQRKIFTKTFFSLSPYDQHAVVTSIVTDIAKCILQQMNSPETKRAERQLRRIVGRALDHGVFSLLEARRWGWK